MTILNTSLPAQVAQEALIKMKAPKGLHTVRTYNKADKKAARKVLDRLINFSYSLDSDQAAAISISPIIPEVTEE